MAASWGANQPGRALLFERLVARPDDWFGEPSRSLPEPRRTHDLDGLRASVLREVRSALSTRCGHPAAALSSPRTTHDYGLVDLDPFAGRSGPSRQTFLRLVRETIEAYEPRLRNVDVELVGPAREAGRLILRITAELAVDEVCEALDFDWSPGDGAGSMGNDGSS